MAPRVSIVTPTFRMAHYLGQTVESVLGQQGVEFDYRVLDGGSQDGTVELLRSYGGRLSWVSEPDGGAAAAIRRGFEEATGEILYWVNADDILLPGALREAVEAFERNPEAVAVFGRALWVDEALRPVGPYPIVEDARERLWDECLICQPACFFRAEAYRACGGIDGNVRCAFDYELWMRLAKQGRFAYVDREWALARMYRENKSLGLKQVSLDESMAGLRANYGYVPAHWYYSRRLYDWNGADQFFERTDGALVPWLQALGDGLRENGGQRGRFMKDWLRPLGKRLGLV